MAERFSPGRMAKRTGRTAWNVARMIQRAPRRLGELVNRLMAGKLGFAFEHKGLENFTLEIERASNRLSFSIVLAALIVGSSLILVSKVGPTYRAFPILGIIGYCAAAVLGFWLLVAILRRGRL